MTSRSDDPRREQRRDLQISIALGASVISAVACVYVALRGPAPAPATASVAPAAAVTQTRVVYVQGPPGAPPPAQGEADGPRAPAAPALPGATQQDTARRGGLYAGPARSPAIAALAEKLHMTPDAVAELAGPDGEVPRDAAARLERATDTGKALGRRLGLDEDRARGLGDVFGDHAFRLILGEREGHGAPLAADRVEEITRASITSARVLLDEAGTAEAERALARLR